MDVSTSDRGRPHGIPRARGCSAHTVLGGNRGKCRWGPRERSKPRSKVDGTGVVVTMPHSVLFKSILESKRERKPPRRTEPARSTPDNPFEEGARGEDLRDP